MANNCSNWIQIQGEKENLNKIKVIFENKNFNLVAEGNALFEINSTDYYKDFGTRWFEVYHIELFDDLILVISGDSAWGPPDAFLQKLSKKFNLQIVLEYEESGNDIGGTKTFFNGKITDEFNTTYQMWRYKEEGISDIINNYRDDMHEYDTFDEWLNDTVNKDVIAIMKKDEREELEQNFNNFKNKICKNN